MLLLAIVTMSGMALARQAGVLPPRADFPRVVLAAALTGGGFGYLLLSPALAWMALLALPLLLIWVAGMGVWLSLDLAASQMTGSVRQIQKPGNRGLLALAPAKARTAQANLVRADHPGQRHLHASVTHAKSPAADHQPGPGRGDCAAKDVASVPSQMATRPPRIVAGRRERLPATRPHDKPGDGKVHPVSITAAR